MTEYIGHCHISHTLENFQLEANFKIPSRGITGIYGASGSGKTTLLRCIAGLEQPPKADININGHCWQSSSKPFVPSYERSIAYVFQDARLFPHLNVIKNLRYGYKRNTQKQNASHSNNSHISFEQIIHLLDLEALLYRQPTHLSGGEQQRVAIARALLKNPELVLMDEPLAALDNLRKQEILPFLERLHENLDLPMLYVSHNIQEIIHLCDRLIVLERGKIIAHDDLQKVISRIDIPLLSGHEASTVLEGEVLDYDKQDNITRIQVAENILYSVGDYLSGLNQSSHMLSELNSHSASSNKKVRIRIMAKDISLTRDKPKQTSILNILPVTIDDYEIDKKGYYNVRLRCASNTLTAQITKRSWRILQLKKQQEIFAQIKSIALKQPSYFSENDALLK